MNTYQQSKVNQWTSNIVEAILKRLCALNKPFKYIGESLSVPRRTLLLEKNKYIFGESGLFTVPLGMDRPAWGAPLPCVVYAGCTMSCSLWFKRS